VKSKRYSISCRFIRETSLIILVTTCPSNENDPDAQIRIMRRVRHHYMVVPLRSARSNIHDFLAFAESKFSRSVHRQELSAGLATMPADGYALLLGAGELLGKMTLRWHDLHLFQNLADHFFSFRSCTPRYRREARRFQNTVSSSIKLKL